MADATVPEGKRCAGDRPVPANRRTYMRTSLPLVAVATALMLSACQQEQEAAVENRYENMAAAAENAAESVMNRAENMAENVTAAAENKAEELRNKAEALREEGENRADVAGR
ncbi:MAG TPA: hypothetical protein VL918_13990 [Sphingobium sp.]|nr:hypothetical protein [Sphingobium sp.]